MASKKYSKTSPYYTTDTYGNFLDVMSYRSIPALVDDVVYTIDTIYEYRPDLLAYDLYNDAKLWWVFAVRNPNVLKNPLLDFRSGIAIQIPKKTTIMSALGL